LVFQGYLIFLPLLCLARAQLSCLCVTLHFCHRTNENFTVLDSLHAWLLNSLVQRGNSGGSRRPSTQ
jgi:hypothetical protein